MLNISKLNEKIRKGEQLRLSALISIAYLLILFIGSILFYRQRIFVDFPFISWLIINADSLQIQVERYGSFITQIFPWIAGHYHLPLKYVLLLYSMSFNLFYLGTAIILYRYKDYILVILLAFYLSLFVSDNYFWTNIELHQGICWMMLMFVFIRHRLRKEADDYNAHPLMNNIFTYSGFTVLCFIAIYTHPIVIIPLFFLLIFFWVSEKNIKPKQMILQLLIIAAILFFKVKLSTVSWYDGSFITKLSNSGLQEIIDTFSSSLADRFWQGILHNYWLMAIIFICSMIHLAKLKKWLMLSWCLMSNVGFFILLCLSFKGNLTIFYFEGEFGAFGILGTTAFVYYVLPEINKSFFVVSAILIIFIIRLTYIGCSAIEFNNRLSTVTHIMQFMDREKISKMIIPKFDERLEDKLIMSWSLPYEVLAHSVINGDAIAKTCIYQSPDELSRYTLKDSLKDFRGAFKISSFKEVNRYYFNYDTSQPYRTVHYNEIFKD